MAGNNAIQILRANSATIANSSETLLAGQPLYNTDKNYLTIGANDGDTITRGPITCRELVGYDGDTDSAIGSSTNTSVYIKANNKGLDVLATSGININSWDGNINIYGAGISANLGSGAIRLNSNSGTFITDSSGGPSLTLQSPGASLYGYYLNLTGNDVNISGDNGVTISAYSGVTINQAGNIITFPNKPGTLSIASFSLVNGNELHITA